jgi:hypothetical protein
MQKDVLRALFGGMQIGYTNAVISNSWPVADAAVDDLVAALSPSSRGVRELFYDDPPGSAAQTANAFAGCVPAGAPTNDLLREAALRQTVELLTFRQNLFTVVIAARLVAQDGTTTLAERRALAVVCRDAYTGKWFVRTLRWLTG